MRTRFKLVTAAVAASVVIGSMTAPASAQVRGHVGGGGGVSTGAKFLGICVFGGAAGLIWAALAKGQAYNNDKIELTRQEAFGIAFSCGLYTFPVIASWRTGN